MTNNLCRLCLSIYDLVWAFDPNQDGLHDIISATTGVEILRTDPITQQICSQCCQITKKMYIFRTKSLTCDSLLKEKYAKITENETIIILDKPPDDPQPIILPTPPVFAATKLSEHPRPSKNPHPSIVQMQNDNPTIKFPRLSLNSHFLPFITLITDEVDEWFASRNISKTEVEQLKNECLKVVAVEENDYGEKSKTDKSVTNKNAPKISKKIGKRSKRVKLNHNLQSETESAREVDSTEQLHADGKEFPPIPPIILKRVALSMKSDIYKTVPTSTLEKPVKKNDDRRIMLSENVSAKNRESCFNFGLHDEAIKDFVSSVFCSDVFQNTRRKVDKNSACLSKENRSIDVVSSNKNQTRQESWIILDNQPSETSGVFGNENSHMAASTVKENRAQMGDVGVTTSNKITSNIKVPHLFQQKTNNSPQVRVASGSEDEEGFRGFKENCEPVNLTSPKDVWGPIYDKSCDFPVSLKSPLLTQAIKSQRIYTCQVCNSVFDTSRGLKLHQRMRHTKCPFCQIKFRSLLAKLVHVKNDCPKNCYSQLKLKDLEVKSKKGDEVQTVTPSVMVAPSNNSVLPVIAANESQMNICENVEISNSEPFKVVSSSEDVICLSDEDEAKKMLARKPKITISDNNCWNTINLRDNNGDIMKKLLDQKSLAQPAQDVATCDAIADDTQIYTNLRNYLYCYNIPLEIHPGNELTFKTVTPQDRH